MANVEKEQQEDGLLHQTPQGQMQQKGTKATTTPNKTTDGLWPNYDLSQTPRGPKQETHATTQAADRDLQQRATSAKAETKDSSDTKEVIADRPPTIHDFGHRGG